MDTADFRRHGHELVEWIADYFDNVERYPVLSRAKPGDIAAALPASAPEDGEPFDAIMADFERVLVPGLTTGIIRLFAHFAITASLLASWPSSRRRDQPAAMLWRTSPASTELEAVSLDWLRQLIGLPAAFEGVIYDTAWSRACTRCSRLAKRASATSAGAGWPDAGICRRCAYCLSSRTRRSTKGVIAIGLGHESLRKIPVDNEYRMRPTLRDAIAEDRAAGHLPIAVVATVGTTSTTSVDPVADVADVRTRRVVAAWTPRTPASRRCCRRTRTS